MIIDCIADLHGFYPKLEGGDLLIVAGDLTARGYEQEYFHFFNWFYEQIYKKKILIAGNHDTQMQKENYQGPQGVMKGAFDYLCDSGTEFEGLKIWGSPWTRTFKGMNPHCKAFTVDTEEELAEKWSLIPDDIDILVTHSPPWGILDLVRCDFDLMMGGGRHCGSQSLASKIGKMNEPPKLWVFGHIHEGYGIDLPIRGKPCKMINASHVNDHYHPVNKPIRVVL
jgi:Icc-related predicted phosphoesterase